MVRQNDISEVESVKMGGQILRNGFNRLSVNLLHLHTIFTMIRSILFLSKPHNKVLQIFEMWNIKDVARLIYADVKIFDGSKFSYDRIYLISVIEDADLEILESFDVFQRVCIKEICVRVDSEVWKSMRISQKSFD